MNIVVLDDDLDFLDIMLDKLPALFDARIRVFNEYVEGIINETDNIVFLDVMLENQESFDLGARLLERFPNLVLVYISSFDHFVYDSYKQKTFFFVRKSNLDRDLREFSIKYNKLVKDDEIEITFKNKSMLLKHRDIVYVESKRNKLFIHTHYHIYETYMSMIQFEKMLDSKYFHRFNSHLLLNLNHVQSVEKNNIQLSTGTKIDYTRDSKKKFILVYSKYRGGDL